jgi:hypothetical protein
MTRLLLLVFTLVALGAAQDATLTPPPDSDTTPPFDTTPPPDYDYTTDWNTLPPETLPPETPPPPLPYQSSKGPCDQYDQDYVVAYIEANQREHVPIWEALEEMGHPYKTSQERIERAMMELQSINSHNADSGNLFCRTINLFSFLDEHELGSFKGLTHDTKSDQRKILDNETIAKYFSTRIPPTVDYRKATGPVLDQGHCASSWAFTAAQVLIAIEYMELGLEVTEYAPQQLINCVYSNGGCVGGSYADAWKYWSQQKKMAGGEMPYEAEAHTEDCTKPSAEDNNIASVNFASRTAQGPTDEEDLQYFVARHPIAIAIEARRDFFEYHRGVYHSDLSCGKELDHAMLIVGYGTDPGKGDYWIVKNHWGSRWGEGGFVRVKRGVNTCGVADLPMFPTLRPGSRNIATTFPINRGPPLSQD